MSDKLLITILGRPILPRPREGQASYRRIPYRFPDGTLTEPLPFLGAELTKREDPDRLIVLGTSGSIWEEFFLESVISGEYDEDALSAIIDAAREKRVRQEQLKPLQTSLSLALGRPVDLLLISEGRTRKEQLDLLTALADHVGEGDQLVLDLTHGMRHLPVLLLLAAVYLRSIRNARIQSAYYGFYDPETDEGIVFDLAGLLALVDWVTALHAFDKDGDPGVFAELLQADGASAKAVSALRAASYHGKVLQHERAWTQERTLANELHGRPPDGVSGLFAPHLESRLADKTGSGPALRLSQMARRHLEHGNYDRAILLGLAAARASCQQPGTRLKEVHQKIMDGEVGDNEFVGAYNLLYAIRNCIAHPEEPQTNREANRAMQSEVDLRSRIESLFGILLKDKEHSNI